jgi:hypothetical protein
MADLQRLAEIAELAPVDRHKGGEELPAPRVDRLDTGSEQLVLLAPAGALLAPGRGLLGEAVEQGQQPARRLPRRLPQVEAVEALEIGLDKVPAFF